MKHFRKLFYALTISVLALQCSRPTDPPPLISDPSDELPAQLTAEERQVAASSASFGLKLFSEIISSEPENKNICVSPLSLAYALGMTANGAKNATLTEIIETLQLEGLSIDDLNRSFKFLTTRLRQADTAVVLDIANSIWYRESAPVLQEFIDVNKEYFDALVREIDFQADWAADTINDWVDQNTNGKIDGIVEAPLDPSMVMLLLNAVYFNGFWTVSFDSALTEPADFYLTDGSTVTVDMMTQDTILPYLREENFEAVSLPYGNGLFAMTLILPQDSLTVDNLIPFLTSENWKPRTDAFFMERVILGLPRFTFEYEVSLNQALQSLGIESAFNAIADFSGITDGGGIWINQVKQKTFIQVDESGTEAAAVTSIDFRASTPPVISLNRPFIFVIHERTSGAILFIGRVSDPS